MEKPFWVWGMEAAAEVVRALDTGRARRHQPRGPRCLGRAVRGHAPRPRPVARSDKLTRREYHADTDKAD